MFSLYTNSERKWSTLEKKDPPPTPKKKSFNKKDSLYYTFQFDSVLGVVKKQNNKTVISNRMPPK